MADHYSKALAYLDLVEVKRADLLDEYDSGLHRREVLSQLHQDIGAAMKLADIHASLAYVSAINDLRQTFEASR